MSKLGILKKAARCSAQSPKSRAGSRWRSRPNANPPVCRIIDFGKFRYQLRQAMGKGQKAPGRQQAQGNPEFRVNIDPHDYHTNIRRGEEFLDKGNKVKVQLQFRGREMAHQELGMGLMHRVKEDLNTMANVEMEPKLMGQSINMTLSPLPANKRKRKFEPHTEEELKALDDHVEADEED